MSAEVSLTLGEVKRVDLRLEKALAEFSEDWYGVKFEIAILGNLTWEIGDDALLKSLGSGKRYGRKGEN